MTFKAAFLSTFAVLLGPAFLFERHLETAGLVDSKPLFTLYVAAVGAAVVAAGISFVLVRVVRS